MARHGRWFYTVEEIVSKFEAWSQSNPDMLIRLAEQAEEEAQECRALYDRYTAIALALRARAKALRQGEGK